MAALLQPDVLDAGQHLSRFESHYTIEGDGAIRHAAGIKKQADSMASKNLQAGILRTWETVKEAGHVGCGIVVDPSLLVDFAEADGNYLVVANVPRATPAVYYAGFAWDKSGDFAALADWDRYLDLFARRLRAPIDVQVGSRTRTSGDRRP